VDNFYNLAIQLGDGGHQVTCCLIENGVMAARPSDKAGQIKGMLSSKVKVVADDFSLSERAINSDQLVPGVEIVDVDFVVDRLAAGDKVMWY
jgi:intracellular sulfur oxidation DsrE/DsrF family protein